MPGHNGPVVNCFSLLQHAELLSSQIKAISNLTPVPAPGKRNQQEETHRIDSYRKALTHSHTRFRCGSPDQHLHDTQLVLSTHEREQIAFRPREVTARASVHASLRPKKGRPVHRCSRPGSGWPSGGTSCALPSEPRTSKIARFMLCPLEDTLMRCGCVTHLLRMHLCLHDIALH